MTACHLGTNHRSPVITFIKNSAVRSFFVSVFIAIALTLSLSAPAFSANVPRAYAGIVVDAKTGDTLYSYAADAARYPASVTKVMTLYMLFRELKAGRMTLNTKLNVSSHAAAAVPTKLYVRSGSTIRVEDAIKALVTLSANDVARVIAENIGGSESKFAEMMTAAARGMGMNRTTYANASGLPDRRQVTTVRDQAKLGMAVFQHYPEYYHYFQLRSFTYKGKTYGNHNRLLGSNGVDGLKTGYINASGYNLLTAARANNRHIVVVGFGFSSGGARNAKVLELVKKYIGRGRRGDYWRQAMIPRPSGSISAPGNPFAIAADQPVTPMPLPSWRTTTPANVLQATPIAVASIAPIEAPTPLQSEAPLPLVAPVAVAARPIEVAPAPTQAPTPLAPPVDLMAPTQNVVASVAPVAQQRPLEVVGNWLSDNFQADNPQQGVLGYLPVGGNAPVPPGNVGQTVDLMSSGSIGQQQVATGANGWVVQVGATPSQESAQQLIQQANTRLGALQDYRPYVEQFQNVGQVFYRARFSGFATRDQAVAMCNLVQQSNMSCLAVQS